MEEPLVHLKQRAGEDWLIGHDSNQFNHLTEQLFHQLAQLSKYGTPPKILIAEQNPLRFLAAFLAAVAAGCPVFLCNPNWVQQEWQEVFDLVQPDLIFGQEANPPLPLPPSPPLPLSHSRLIMIPTGGSSGKIRFAVHTWETLMASVRGFHQYFGEKPINSFCVLPLYHVSGLMQFLRSFTTGGRIVILPFKALVAGEGCHIDPTEFFISLVPTQLARLISLDSSEDLRTRSLSAPLTPPLVRGEAVSEAAQSTDAGWEEQNPIPPLPPKVGRVRACFQTSPSDSDPPKSELKRTLTEFSPLVKGGWGGSPGLKTLPRGGWRSEEESLNSASAWLSRFQAVLLGGAPAWKSLLEQARRHSIPLALTYGMTETASQVVTLKPEDFLKGNNSSGQVLPHAQVTIRSSTGEILGENQIGIITIQADSLALGYYPINPKSKIVRLSVSALSLSKGHAEVQNLKSDDLGFFDEQGYLTIIGRRSNKIITGGENVFPAEVEAAIQGTQLVADVCVIGVPDSQWGQIVTAVYVPQTQAISTEVLKTALADKLSKYKRPKYWVQVESLPRNSQGKVNYEQLQTIVTAWLESQKASSLTPLA
jgi:acyl-CoA synthetase (AMP-forming)/AMP-acid ligase II